MADLRRELNRGSKAITTRRADHHVRATAHHRVPGRRLRAVARLAERRGPAAADTISGTQCPAVKGGSVHSSIATRGRSLSATAAATRSSRDPNAATNSCAAGARPILSPTVTMETSTSCKVCGSTVTTCAWQPRCFSAASTVCTHGTHRAQILGEDEIGIQLPQRALVQPVQILPGSQPGPDLGVDLARRQPGGQR